MEMRSLRRICRVSLTDRIRNEQIHRTSDTREDAAVRKKKFVDSWLGHVKRMSNKRTAKKIYEEKVRGKGRPRLTFENTVKSETLHVKSMRSSCRACMKRLKTEDEAKKVCKGRSVWRSILLDYPARDTA